MRPVNSIKHIIDQQGGLVAGVRQNVTLVSAKDNPATTATADVQVGGRVNSIFLNIQVVNETDVALANVYMIIFKNPGNNIQSAQIPDANETGVSDFRKQIFHTEMAMMSDAGDSIPITLFKGVLKLPQRFQRMGINDNVTIQLKAPGTDVNFCVQCIYKEYR